MKGLLNALSTLVYVFIVTIFVYFGWVGWFRLFSYYDEDKPLIASGIDMLILIIIFLLSVFTDGVLQEDIMLLMIWYVFCNIIFIIVGLILYAFIPDKKL